MIAAPAESLVVVCVAAHNWQPTGLGHIHVGTKIAIYVKCEDCGWVGFRYPPKKLVYTWEQE